MVLKKLFTNFRRLFHGKRKNQIDFQKVSEKVGNGGVIVISGRNAEKEAKEIAKELRKRGFRVVVTKFSNKYEIHVVKEKPPSVKTAEEIVIEQKNKVKNFLAKGEEGKIQIPIFIANDKAVEKMIEQFNNTHKNLKASIVISGDKAYIEIVKI